MYTSVPAFPKFSLCHFTFTKDLPEHLFLLTETNLKMIFTYRKKVKNEKPVFSSCFQQAVREAVYTRGRVGTAQLLPQERHEHLSTKLLGLCTVSEHLCCASITCLVHLVTRCLLRYYFFVLCHFSLGMFSHNTLLSDSRGKPV